LPSRAQEKPLQPPPILGISHVRFYVTQPQAAVHFYKDVLGLTPAKEGCENAHFLCFWISHSQFVQLDPVEQRRPTSFLEEVAFATPDLKGMRNFLVSNDVRPDLETKKSGRLTSFCVLDPEGNRVVFEEQQNARIAANDHSVSSKLLHAGFVVKDLDRMKKFYIDLLGFRLYWYGGFKDDGVDWYEIRVPDGDNWIEFMLNISPTADHRELGVQNHFSLGVNSVTATAARLRANGATNFDGPEIGRDGKNALDIYDPDLSRVEIMDFTPSQKPCCHPYTAPHPKP
jgi:catechol 2,3-dioxygenase-like lactoylglutathione lyase family enzyme